MPAVHVRWSIERRSGIPRDRVVMTHSLLADDMPLTQLAAACEVACNGFLREYAQRDSPNNYSLWTAENHPTTPVQEYLSQALDPGPGVRIQATILNDLSVATPEGSPDIDTTVELDLSEAGGEPIASRICVAPQWVTSTALNRPLEAPDDGDPDSAPERPRSREWGGFLVGPLNTTASTPGAGNEPRVDGAFRNTLAGGLLAMWVRYLQLDCTLGIWSREDQEIRAVETFRIPDAFAQVASREKQRTDTTTQIVDLDGPSNITINPPG